MRTTAKIAAVASLVTLAGCSYDPVDPGALEGQIAAAKDGDFGVCYTHIHAAAVALEEAEAEMATIRRIKGSYAQPYLDRGLDAVNRAIEARNAADVACHVRVKALEDQMPGIYAKLDDHEARIGSLENIHALMRGVTFHIGSSTLTPPAKSALDIIGNILLRNPQDAEIAGHASTPGNPDFNKALSSRRANTVRNYLIGLGVNGSRLTARGYGESDPVADDSTREGRRANQRVELNFGG